MTELAELKSRLVDTADAEGLLDIAYTSYDAPMGELLLAATPRGLVRVSFAVEDPEVTLAQLASEISPRILERPARLDEARRELDEYFAGDRREFDLDLDWRLSSGFRRRVLRATARIPFGGTSTYSKVARRRGQSEGPPGRRNGARGQPASDRRPMPPGPPHGRRARGLRRRARDEGAAAGAGGRPRVAGRTQTYRVPPGDLTGF